jgi:hypothetical protein
MSKDFGQSVNPKSLANEEAYQKQFKKNIERLFGHSETINLAEMTASREFTGTATLNLPTPQIVH